MQAMPISEVTMLWQAILYQVNQTKTPVLITSEGRCVAEIHPPSDTVPRPRRLGGLKGSVTILGDILSPASAESDWEALQP